ncbi:MAG: TetR/AcrR family transcriptional regulator [Candidatus Ornithomonoglobus sp.]
MAQTTKKMLAYALAELLKTKPLGKITINDITSKCGVNRMTFYYHFKDIYELLDWMTSAKSFVPPETVYEGDWWDSMVAITDYALKNKDIIINVYNSLGREDLEKYFVHIFVKIFAHMADALSGQMDITDDDKEFVVYFYSKAVCGLMLDWIDSGMTLPSDEQQNRLKRMLDGNMEFSLENMRRDKN